MFKKFRKFLSEVKTELSKATWPYDPKEKGFKRFKELYDSTIIVLIAMIMLGAYVGLTDLILVNVSKVFGGPDYSVMLPERPGEPIAEDAESR
ncbi:MAG: preprotein translocase subunit SecE [Verrucomicrobiales bacterium]